MARKRSEVVMALATMASQGRYNVTPVEARRFDELFQEVAAVINSLEKEEKEAEAPQEAGNDADSDVSG